jgi:hypothetical protein
MGLPDLGFYFPPLESASTRRAAGQYWRAICVYLGWAGFHYSDVPYYARRDALIAAGQPFPFAELVQYQRWFAETRGREAACYEHIPDIGKYHTVTPLP